MKLNKEEIKKKIDEYDISDDVKISLLEDIEDSFNEDSFDIENYVSKEDYEKLKADLEDSKRKYKERFFDSKEEIKDEEKEDEEKEDESEDEKVIDIKEIFEDSKDEEKE